MVTFRSRMRLATKVAATTGFAAVFLLSKVKPKSSRTGRIAYRLSDIETFEQQRMHGSGIPSGEDAL
jgi:hypothetical protein